MACLGCEKDNQGWMMFVCTLCNIKEHDQSLQTYIGRKDETSVPTSLISL